jgi:hypothetical protein
VAGGAACPCPVSLNREKSGGIFGFGNCLFQLAPHHKCCCTSCRTHSVEEAEGG